MILEQSTLVTDSENILVDKSIPESPTKQSEENAIYHHSVEKSLIPDNSDKLDCISKTMTMIANVEAKAMEEFVTVEESESEYSDEAKILSEMTNNESQDGNFMTGENHDELNKPNSVDQNDVFTSDENYPIHKIREGDALMNDDQYNALKLDILAYGQLEPIVLFREDDGQLSVLDGRNRKRACSDNKMTPIYKIFSGDNDMLYEFVKSKQIHRAHYTKDQLACYAAEVKEDVKKHNRELLSIKMKAIASNPEISKELPAISTHEYLEQMFGVGKQYISQAENILKNDLETFQKVKLGTLSLNAAMGNVADKKKVIAKEKKVIESDLPLEEKSIKTSFTFVEDAKVKEYIGLGLAKKEAETKVTELYEKVKNIIDAHKEESRIKIEISLPISINKYLDDTLKDSGQSIDELFTAWIISFANFNDEENI